MGMQGSFDLSIERTFNATHALKMYDGQLEPMHGHDWHVVVTLAAPTLDQIDVVVDFHEIEMILEQVLSPWQHACLNDDKAFAECNPSAERVAECIAEKVSEQLPDRVRLISVAVTEAPGCVATFRPSQ
jgi:6-pyruvoyltetrahydropterin/6-carboxytetrahydropterin synthase